MERVALKPRPQRRINNALQRFTSKDDALRPGGFYDPRRNCLMGPEEVFVRMAWQGRMTVNDLLKAMQYLAKQKERTEWREVMSKSGDGNSRMYEHYIDDFSHARRWVQYLDVVRLKAVAAAMEPYRPRRYRINQA